MVRIKSNISAKSRKKRVLKKAKGQFGRRSKHFRQAIKSVIKGMTYEYRDRKVKKREFRSLWILRINAACRENGISYSRFIKGLNDAKVDLNRKVISELASSSPDAFKKLVQVAREGAPKEIKKAAPVKAAAKSAVKPAAKAPAKAAKKS